MSICCPEPLSWLSMKASVWRGLMAVGMKFHRFADPKPPSPNFEIIIPSRLSTPGGTFKLVFYVPISYFSQDDDARFPVVVNFHGGGFTIGTGTDDARWASAVVSRADAVFVSVEYRLAPEYPFSVGVEDATDAVIYLASHAEELRLDPHRIALSGFSAGGNFTFAVPLILHDLQHDAGKRSLRDHSKTLRHPANSQLQSSSSHLLRPTISNVSGSASTVLLPQSSNSTSLVKVSSMEPTALEMTQKVPDLTIVSIVAFYPVVDFRPSRQEKRATNPQPGMDVSVSLTNLFDTSYFCQSACDLADPYLSPAAASDESLKAAYPEDIVLYTCEYDMLNPEGVEFGQRLRGQSIGKTVHGGMIEGVGHAFDKRPNPLSFPKAADVCYADACAELKRVFGGMPSADEQRRLEEELSIRRFESGDAGDEVSKAPVLGTGGQNREEKETNGLLESKESLSQDRLDSGEGSTTPHTNEESNGQSRERREGESSESSKSKSSQDSKGKAVEPGSGGRSPELFPDAVP